ncbi:hypothetical protein [Bacillus thuringiensis]|uniref:hypothetical protein n=1 Tax=Bacillus thuringiensis TaxID=1428 RepID=UPI00159B8910|nr:hypothetical protein [Bacillus thuringiensis]
MFEILFSSLLIGALTIAIIMLIVIIADDILPIIIFIVIATLLGFLIQQAFKLIS